jgi:hypothetical protein
MEKDLRSEEGLKKEGEQGKINVDKERSAIRTRRDVRLPSY